MIDSVIISFIKKFYIKVVTNLSKKVDIKKKTLLKRITHSTYDVLNRITSRNSSSFC